MLRQLLQWKWILPTLLVLAAVGVMVRLGFWQLDRLEQRRAFNARVLSQIDRPPLDLNQERPLELLPDMEYREVQVSGHYDFSQEVLLRNQAWEGQNGFHILTPLRIEGSRLAVLIDRGWIPYEGHNQLSRYQEPGGLVTVRGILRRPQSQPDFGGVPDPTLAPGQARLEAWNIVNLKRIQGQVSVDLLPVYILQSPEGAQIQLPFRRHLELELTEGSHFGYAVQWFTFASILGLGYPFYLRRQVGGQRSQSGSQKPTNGPLEEKAGL